MKRFFNLLACTIALFVAPCLTMAQKAQNPIIYADVPDMSMIRVGGTYYMTSTTMHMSPGVPIMKSNDLVNWRLINYAYDTLANVHSIYIG
jgi:beta-xylosidase